MAILKFNSVILEKVIEEEIADFETVHNMYDILLDELGAEQLAEAMFKYTPSSYEEKKDLFEYIAKKYGVELYETYESSDKEEKNKGEVQDENNKTENLSDN